jgi:hypothetical protein
VTGPAYHYSIEDEMVERFLIMNAIINEECN